MPQAAAGDTRRRKLNFHPIRFLKAKLSGIPQSHADNQNHSLINNRDVTVQHQASSDLTAAAATAAVEPPSDDVCPSFEDFGAEAATLFSLDIIEGCRITLNRNFNPKGLGEIGVSQMVNLGTYPSIGSQAALLRALLQPQTTQGAKGSKGEQQWATSLRYSPPGGLYTFLTRYSSRNGTTEGRMIASLSQYSTLRGTFLSSNVSNYLFLMKGLFTNKPNQWGQVLRKSEISRDIGIATLERNSPATCLTLKASYQESPVYTVAYSAKLSPRWAVGTDLTVLKSSGAVISNYGSRFKSDNVIGSAIVSCTPNFEKPINEGLKERVYGFRSNVVRKVSDRITAGAEVEINPFIKANVKESLSNLKDNCVCRVGYEYQFTQARVCGSIDSNLCLQQTVEDATGLQMSGELDFKNDNYRFGFGFELASLGQQQQNPFSNESISASNSTTHGSENPS